MVEYILFPMPQGWVKLYSCIVAYCLYIICGHAIHEWTSFGDFVLCVRVSITLAPEIPRCGSDRGNILSGSRVTDPQTHFPLGSKYIPGWPISLGIGWYLCK